METAYCLTQTKIEVMVFKAFHKPIAVIDKTLLLAMKFTTLLLFIVSLQVGAAGYAQKVTFSGKGIPLEKVFKELERQTGYEFFYTEELMQQAKKVDLVLKNVSIN